MSGKHRRPFALGIDFGGTSVKCGLLDSTGRILRRRDFPTAEASTPGDWVARVGDIGL